MNFKIFAGKKILVTGHTGFKGSWLLSILRELDCEIFGYSLPPEENSLSQLLIPLEKDHEVLGDIRNLDLVHSSLKSFAPDVIFHLAAQPLVSESYKDPLSTFSTNVMGTANLLEAGLDIPNLQAFIAITTDKVYKNLEKGLAFSESDPLGGEDPYSASKSATEMAVTAWRYFYGLENKQLISVRAGNVIGAGDRARNRLLPDLILKARDNQSIEIRNPESTRPWQHVLEPLFGYMIVAEQILLGRKLSESFNFGPQLDSHLTVGKVADLVCSELNFSAGWKYVPDGLGIPESRLLHLNSDRALKELKWQSHLSASEAIRWTLEAEALLQLHSASSVIQNQIRNYRDTYFC